VMPKPTTISATQNPRMYKFRFICSPHTVSLMHRYCTSYPVDVHKQVRVMSTRHDAAPKTAVRGQTLGPGRPIHFGFYLRMRAHTSRQATYPRRARGMGRALSGGDQAVEVLELRSAQVPCDRTARNKAGWLASRMSGIGPV
jgi:hypothetical protein